MVNMNENFYLFKCAHTNHCTNNWIKKCLYENIGIRKLKITVILTFIASGKAPLLIFKVNEGKDFKKIAVDRVCREKRVFVF